MSQITYTLATKEHVDMMNEIEKESFTTPWSYQSIYDDVVKNSIAQYLVALDDKKVVAYAGSWHVAGEAHITTLAVQKNYRRQHIGENILAYMFSLLIKEDIMEVTLEVRKSNIAAIGLYRKLGFYEAGIRKNYYTDSHEDAIIMWKNL